MIDKIIAALQQAKYSVTINLRSGDTNQPELEFGANKNEVACRGVINIRTFPTLGKLSIWILSETTNDEILTILTNALETQPVRVELYHTFEKSTKR